MNEPFDPIASFWPRKVKIVGAFEWHVNVLMLDITSASLVFVGVCRRKSVEVVVVDTRCWLTCEEIVGYSSFQVRLVAAEHSLPECRGLQIVSHII